MRQTEDKINNFKKIELDVLKEREPEESKCGQKMSSIPRTISLCTRRHMARSFISGFDGIIEKQKEYEIELKIAKMRGDSEMIKQCESDLIIERHIRLQLC